jgi:hypothetical protein
VFGRRSTPSEPVGATAADAEKLSGKGRATPTRKEAEAQRKQRMTPPKTRKEQAARQRELTRDNRTKMRTALQTGEDAYLPLRDQGPVKRYVRDYVDSRRTMGEILLPIFFVVFALVVLGGQQFANLGTYAWLVIIVLMVVDSVRISRGSKAAIAAKFGPDSTKGTGMYAVMRAWQMRRLRLPKPQVKSGDTI